MVFRKTDVVFWMPVASSDYDVEEIWFAELIDQAENVERARNFEAATFAEIVLNVDDNESRFFENWIV